MATTTAAALPVEALRTALAGEVVAPGDPGYDDARRVFNGMIDRRPAAIARCTGVADVREALGFARAHAVPFAVRGGGHSVAGYGVLDDGIVVDLAPMKGIHVDPARRVARADAGLTWGELDRETAVFGLATTGGRVSSTGVGGLVLGSGSGWLERTFGLTADNLLSAQVVTADGEVVTASDDENADLFWAIRGGGGNFGIVTSLELRLHPMPPAILGGLLLFPLERAREVAVAYRAFMDGAPDEVLGGLAFITAPPAPFVPEPLQGAKIAGIIAAYAGPVEEGEAALAPLRALGPAADLLAPMPYTALQRLIDEPNQPGLRNYWKAEYFSELPDEAIDVLVERAALAPSPVTQLVVLPLGGAFARVPEDATALGGRSAPWAYHALSVWPPDIPDEANVAWTRDTAAALAQWTRPGIYLNFTSDEGPERVRETYGAGYERLVAAKRKWDPENVFRRNQNVAPA